MRKSKMNREHKGESIVVFPDDYTIVDLETTGFSPTNDDIIEIGALKIRNNTIVDKFSTLVQPNKIVDIFVQDLTSITNSDLVEAPELDDIIDEFIKFVGDDIIVGHNIASFDINFLYDNILKLRGSYFSNNLVDTLSISKTIYNNFASHKLSFLAKQLKINVSVAHRALADCYTTFELYKILKSKDCGNNKVFDTLNNNNSFSFDVPRSKSDYLFDYKFDNTNPFYNKICVFTGDLEIMSRQKATELVEKMGGFCKNSVGNKTDYLIVGEYNEFSKFMMKGKKSSKLLAAEELIEKGRDVKIIDETEFIDIVESSHSIENCINCDTPFYQQGVCFIGSMDNLLRVDAINMLHTLGAIEKENVSRNSQYVVIGDYDASLKNVKDNLKKIDELAEKGIQVTTLTPEQFKDMLFKYCDYSQIVSAQDILNKISSSLNGKYKKIVKLYLEESKSVYTFVKALAKETPWHPELSGKTIMKIGVSDIVFSNYMKSVLNKLKIEYSVDSTDFYHIKDRKSVV